MITLKAINKLIENNIIIVNTKKIRRCNHIKSSDRSKINFIWRSLKFLADKGYLEKNGDSSRSPTNYRITLKEKIEVEYLFD